MFVVNKLVTFSSGLLNRITFLVITVSTLLQVSVAKRKTHLTVRTFTLEQLGRVLRSRRGEHVKTRERENVRVNIKR